MSEPQSARFEKLASSIDPGWIEAALTDCAVASVRRRRLPADLVCWVVVGMALFRDLSIVRVIELLGLTLADGRGRPLKSNAIAQARERLGPEPLQWLLRKLGATWALESARKESWRGLALFCVDGSKLNVPDSVENREHFGDHTTQHGTSGYPIARIVTLMAARSHLLVDARMGPFVGTSEHSLCEDLWPVIPDDSLTLLDRGFLSARILVRLARDGRNRHWLTRAKADTQWRELRRLGPDDTLVELTVSKDARRIDPSLPETWSARVIRYKRRGFRESFLITSLVDPERFPMKELVALYHERWEIELGYREVKRYLLHREEALRSRTINGVYQEFYGIAVAYNLVRREMDLAARAARVAPNRLSFKDCYDALTAEFVMLEYLAPSKVPEHLALFRERLGRYQLAPRRSRSAPRGVKLPVSRWPSLRTASSAARKPK